jgi:hypothetical protein
MALPKWNFEVPVTANPVIGRTDVAAVALNVTVTDPLSPGYVTLTPAGANDPAATERTTATVSIVRAAQTLPSHAIVGVSPRGFDVFTLSGAHVIADVTGYFLGRTLRPRRSGRPRGQPAPPGCVGLRSQPRRRDRHRVEPGVGHAGAAAAARSRLLARDRGRQYGLTTSQAVMAFQKWHGSAHHRRRRDHRSEDEHAALPSHAGCERRPAT